ncbi:hypothetical protein DPMN_062364 [Dreissena polymorpha]|uniref:Uncharacterized protein n=1 Tax=Dreissena polymorpha TaxID=45954 RepID=A0A9D4C8N7_DREPO|nr:hypothetical protein DPMN_062353 [Dreissena polymorpha]KAH3719527.1 hypothetical protein DPMN_062364 [Dreissena polymorpha]
MIHYWRTACSMGGKLNSLSMGKPEIIKWEVNGTAIETVSEPEHCDSVNLSDCMFPTGP